MNPTTKHAPADSASAQLDKIGGFRITPEGLTMNGASKAESDLAAMTDAFNKLREQVVTAEADNATLRHEVKINVENGLQLHAQLAAMREERDELNRRLEEQHKLYCEETKRHNETWAKIHAATGYLNKEFKKLPEDLLEAVKEVVFRVTLVELGRNSLQGEVAELRDKRKQLIEKLRESVNDTRELNDIAEALVAERTDLRTQLATLRRERDELKIRLTETALSLGYFDLAYHSLQSKALSLVRTGRPFSGSQSAVLTSALEELKTAAEAKSPEWPARAKQGEGQPEDASINHKSP